MFNHVILGRIGIFGIFPFGIFGWYGLLFQIILFALLVIAVYLRNKEYK